MDVNENCPYCEHENCFEIESEDLEDWEMYTHNCDMCDKEFWIMMHRWDWFTWNVSKLPCANWEWHNFSTTSFGYKTWPKKRCSECWTFEVPLTPKDYE